MLNELNKFGMIPYNYQLYIPVKSHLIEMKNDVELYDIDVLPLMGNGWECNRTFGGRYSTWVPLEYQKKDDGSIDFDLEPTYGYQLEKLRVASFQPTELYQKDWAGRKQLTRITYAGATHNIAMGSVKRELKRRMTKTMGI